MQINDLKKGSTLKLLNFLLLRFRSPQKRIFSTQQRKIFSHIHGLTFKYKSMTLPGRTIEVILNQLFPFR